MTQTEQWRGVVGWPDYEVSNHGRVRRLSAGLRTYSGRVLRHDQSSSYDVVTLYDSTGEKARRRRSVHILVAEAFIGPRVGRTEVNHKNANKRDNRAENLEYVTSAGNKRHADRLGILARGERINTAKLTAEQVLEIRRLYAAGGVTQKALGERFGVSQAQIGYITTRQVWTHI